MICSSLSGLSLYIDFSFRSRSLTALSHPGR